MRVENWAPDKYDGEFNEEAMRRLTECAEIVAEGARVKCPVGTISRPQAKGRPRWTERKPGTLRRSIRVVRKKTKTGKVWKRRRNNIRIYAGSWLAFYAPFVEFGAPHVKKKQAFLRPALYSSIPEIKSILGAR